MPYAASVGTPSSTCTPTFAVSITSGGVQVAAVNALRAALNIFNTGAQTVYVGYGYTPTSTNYSDAIAAATNWKMPVQWQGAVSLAVASTASTVNVSEFS